MDEDEGTGLGSSGDTDDSDSGASCELINRSCPAAIYIGDVRRADSMVQKSNGR
jgi:hypothetical protein